MVVVTGAVTLGRVEGGRSLPDHTGIMWPGIFSSRWHVQEKPRWLFPNPFRVRVPPPGTWLLVGAGFPCGFACTGSPGTVSPGMQESCAPGSALGPAPRLPGGLRKPGMGDAPSLEAQGQFWGVFWGGQSCRGGAGALGWAPWDGLQRVTGGITWEGFRVSQCHIPTVPTVPTGPHLLFKASSKNRPGGFITSPPGSFSSKQTPHASRSASVPSFA